MFTTIIVILVCIGTKWLRKHYKQNKGVYSISCISLDVLCIDIFSEYFLMYVSKHL